MVTDGCVKELRRLLGLGRTLVDSARMAEMNEKTARKYRDDDKLPSQQKTTRTYRTRQDPFADVWDDVRQRLELEPRLKAKTLFEWLQETHEGQFLDSTRRTFERRVAKWRSLHGPGKTVFFDQEHHPGRVAASDFTVCNELGVKIAGRRFEHTFYHCVLTYSNVESVSLGKAIRGHSTLIRRGELVFLLDAAYSKSLTERFCLPRSESWQRPQ